MSATPSKSGRAALILAHYHPLGFSRDDTVELLRESQSRFARTVLVSTQLAETELAKIPADVEVIVRDNVGYDFYSYRVGLAHLSAASDPGGHAKLLHLWPGQNPPPGSGGTRDDYAV